MEVSDRLVTDPSPRRATIAAVITPARLRAVALSFTGAVEVPHMDRAAFRTKRRIFATLPPDGKTANLLLPLDLQEALCDAIPGAFAPVPGGWGRMGYTTVDLRVVSDADLVRALTEAHAHASAPKKAAKPAAKKPAVRAAKKTAARRR